MRVIGLIGIDCSVANDLKCFIENDLIVNPLVQNIYQIMNLTFDPSVYYYL